MTRVRRHARSRRRATSVSSPTEGACAASPRQARGPEAIAFATAVEGLSVGTGRGTGRLCAPSA
jgi:hypothetical protein